MDIELINRQLIKAGITIRISAGLKPGAEGIQRRNLTRVIRANLAILVLDADRSMVAFTEELRVETQRSIIPRGIVESRLEAQPLGSP